MQGLKGYHHLEKLHESKNCSVYRALEESLSRPIILKIFNKKYPTPEEAAKFDQEYQLAARFSNEGIIQVYELAEIDHSIAIIMEDIGAQSLSDCLDSDKLALKDFLRLGVTLTEYLGNIHKRSIIHKDINPSNIIWNSQKDILRIIDFGIATELPQEVTSIKNPNVLEGTLAFISPEQTGRMNRSLDYRSDFYSLGVTFYWMLTGQLPFPTTDLLQLLHSHIALKPTPPHEVDTSIPPSVSDIVMKLMAKNAEDRYQSAYGLKVDLENCQHELVDTGEIQSFTLGLKDFSDRFQLPHKLFGRENEIKELMASFERARKGNREIVLISGDAGIGKTALINELQMSIVEQNGYFISGKFIETDKNVPISAIKQALTGLVKQILAEDEKEIEKWKERILSALGPNARIITDLVPIFELIIGKQDDIPILGPNETKNRFSLVFQKFVSIVATPERPLVVFLDNLQWIDSASLYLLKLVTEEPGFNHLVLIGGYRQNEISESHPLIPILKNILQTETPITTIELQPLGQEKVGMLLQNIFKRPFKDIDDLAAELIRKTGGIPFFLNQFLQTLYREKVISFSAEGGWKWDLDGVKKSQATENIVDLMAERIAYLSDDAQWVIKMAACIGSSFSFMVLSAVCGKPKKELLPALSEIIQEGMLTVSDKLYSFTHNRVLKAVYKQIPEKERIAQHYRIGNLGLNHANEEELQENFFYIINHLNAGSSLITDDAEKYNLAVLNFRAGKKALASNAYDSALGYLMSGIKLMDKNGWQNDYFFTLSLYNQATVAAQLCADYKTMDQLILEVQQNARSILDKIKVYEIKIFAYQAQGRSQDVVKTGLRALKKLGISIPEKPSKLAIARELLSVKLLLLGKSIDDIIDLPRMENPRKLAVIQILSGISTSAYTAAPDLVPLMILRTVKLSLKYGNNIFSPYAYAGFGLIQCGVLGNIKEGYQWGNLSRQLVEKFNLKNIKAKVLVCVLLFIEHWRAAFRDFQNGYLEAFNVGIETGDLEFAAIALNCQAGAMLFSGMQLSQVEKDYKTHIETIKHLNQDAVLIYQLMDCQFVLNLRGEVDDPCKLIGSSFDESQMELLFKETNNFTALFNSYIYRMLLNYHFENDKEALRLAELAAELTHTQIASPYIALFYFYDSLIRLALYSSSDLANRKKQLRKCLRNQKKIKNWAHHSSVNYSHKYHLIEAELARVRGKEIKARKHYTIAIQKAHENRYLNEEALSLKLAAKFWLELKDTRIASTYFSEARNVYRMWGANALVKHLEETYGELLEYVPSQKHSNTLSSSTAGSSTSINPATFTQSTQSSASAPEIPSTGSIEDARLNAQISNLDMSSVTKASQALSREMDLKKLLETMIKIMMENAGADKGYVILNRDSSLRIEAAADTNAKKTRILKSIILDESTELSKGIVNYVMKTGKVIVLPSDNEKDLFINDPYLKDKQPKSVLCIPMRYMDKTSGVLYLENHITANAFTKDRIETLNILLSQAAISLENSYVYNHLDELVTERTEEIEKAISDLKKEIEERIRIESALQSAKIEAESANKAKSEFLTNMSHEIRTPLNAVIGFSELLSSLVFEKKQKSYIDAIRTSGKSLLTLINDILDLSKIEAGKLEMQYAPVNPRFIFNEIEQIFKIRVTRKNIKFSIDIDDKLPQSLVLDETRLRQILLNLVGNAVKFTEKGHINLSAKPEFLKNNPAHMDLVLSVEDTGIGISKHEIETIFESFKQQKGQSASKFGGTGLGLSICKRLVDIMGGQITVESTIDKGSKFQIKLYNVPVSTAEFLPVKEDEDDMKSIAFERGKVLVVDDVESNRHLLKELLTRKNLDVITADDGQEAVLLANEYQPDIILMDIIMPVMDGFEATRQIKVNQNTNEIPIIALSASTTLENRSKIMEKGFDGFLSKPVKINSLLSIILKYIDSSSDSKSQISDSVKTDSQATQTDALTSPAHIQKVLTILETKFMEQVKRFESKQPLKEVKQFGEQLTDLGGSYNIDLVKRYGEALTTDVDNFDVQNLRKELNEFPELIIKLRQNIQSGNQK